MSSVSDAGSEGAWRRRGACGGSKWTPIELLAMVLGFMVYWPIGVGLILWKVTQRRRAPGASGADEWFGALRDKFADFAPGGAGSRAFSAGFRAGGTASGNAAFDDWRRQEIERLEEERRKLEKAQADFAEFVEEARKARDREEFERFMNRRPQA